MLKYLTLWDALRDNEEEVVAAVAETVHAGLIELGDNVRQIEWANSDITDARILKAA